MAGGSAPSLLPSLCFSFLPFSPVLLSRPCLFSPPSFLLPSCSDPDLPVMPSRPLPPQKTQGWGGKRRKGRNASTLAGLQAIVPGGPLSVVKPPSSSSYSRFFLLRSFTSYFFAIVAQNNRTSNRKLPHVRLVSCDVKP